MLKTNLHFHTKDDPRDAIPYTFHEGIDEAERLGFEVLALTCHNRFAWNESYARYAAAHNILLIPGIEQDIEGKHVVILNCDASVERVTTFAALAEYKKSHPEAFVLAPHPYFYGNFSLKRELEARLSLFDAIEQSWFYTKRFLNRNRPAERLTARTNLPLIATSDTHALHLLDSHFALIDAEEKTIPAVLHAVREGRFENITRPSTLREMSHFLITLAAATFMKRLSARFEHTTKEKERRAYPKVTLQIQPILEERDKG